MKSKLTLAALVFSLHLFGQTITYDNFSTALSSIITVNVASNASFNPALKTTTGTGVIWDATGLTTEAGTPAIHLGYFDPADTPNADLFPSSDYCFYDPALTAFISYQYYIYNADSISKVGEYEPSTAHEIYDNPDKHLTFPLEFGESFTDTYSKTNYSDATTISSYQTGDRTVIFNGFGTLQLPQGAFTEVALISETRTNSLGPDSYYYTWYNINNGEQLLIRGENAGSVSTAWNTALPTAITDAYNNNAITVFPNPVTTSATITVDGDVIKTNLTLTLYNVIGEEVTTMEINNKENVLCRNGLENGMYLYRITDNNSEILATGKLVFE